MTYSTSSKAPSQRRYQGVEPEDRQRMRRGKLLEAATEVFGKRGFKHGTMRDICAHARLSDRYFYESFRNTEEIFDVVYNTMVSQLIDAMAAGMASSPDSPGSIVRGGLSAFFQFIRDDSRRAQIMLVDAIHAGQYQAQSVQDPMGNGPIDASNSSYNRIVSLLSKAMRFDHLSGIHGQLVACGLMGMAIHTAIAWAQDDFKLSVDEVLEHNFYAWQGLSLWAQQRASAPDAASATSTSPLRHAPEMIEQMLSAFKSPQPC